MSGSLAPSSHRPPAPLTVAASLAAVEGVVLVLLAVLEAVEISTDRLGFGASTAFFFGAYGVLLVVAAISLWRGAAWSRGPVLITQLILLGLAWSLREEVAVALALAAVGGVALAGMLHPASIAALGGARDAGAEGDPGDEADAGQASGSSD
ncbi:hypothetical protein [Nocardioides sp. YIM 152588]|uniref:hypothetical protein n=1 Tax=Nocardioides sp. YIM 152588 TaxID=3158259 RepID=UPI0032E3DE8C